MGFWRWLGRHLKAHVEYDLAVITAIVAWILEGTGVSTLKALFLPMQAAVVAISLGMIRDRLTRRDTDRSLAELSSVTRALAEPALYGTDKIPHQRLLDHIAAHTVREAVFVQYSAKMCADVLRAALDKGANVRLYIQDESTAKAIGSDRQANRVLDHITDTLAALEGNLTVVQFHPPSTIRAIRLDDEILCMGWYTYEAINGRVNYPNDTSAVSGDDRPTMLARSGSHEYEVLNDALKLLLESYEAHKHTKQLRP